MSDTADDLLNELSHLNEATDEMERQVASASSKKADLKKNSQKAASIDAVTVALEAAKTAHMAAEQSQHAAEKAINLAHEQKNQIVELSDANIAWRQSLRSASKDIKSARNAVSVMMSVTITASLATIGGLGWMLYSLNTQYDQLKGDVLDIITTENTLFNKNLTLKVDQLSSLIEALASDIQRVAQQPSPLASKTNTLTDSSPKGDAESFPNLIEEIQAEPKAVTAEAQSTLETAALVAEKSAPLPVEERVDHSEQLAKIEALIQKVISEQQKLHASALSKIAQLATLANRVEPTTNMTQNQQPSFNQKQIAQLNAIATVANNQQQLLKEILNTLKSQPKPSKPAKIEIKDRWPEQQSAFKKLTEQIYAIQQKQDLLVSKVETLEALNNEVLSQPRPYSYRSPDLPIKTLEDKP